ncbi:MAG TPA: hypothetical protein DCG10_00455 [Lachnospiraceae bacterium]|nr:hypothetical protein [Lachnospiraceae bacterium]
MAYTTYEFYKKEYYGDAIPDTAFPKWNDRASTKLDQLTFGNIDADAITEYGEKIQKATCTLADLMYQIDYKNSHANDETVANIKSMSSGGRSVSFGSNETLIDKVLGDKTAQIHLFRDTVCEYLAGTGLLYAGVE